MPPSRHRASIRRRRLGLALRKLRGDRTAKQIAADLRLAESTIGRAERAEIQVTAATLKQLLDYYKVPDASQDWYFDLLKETRDIWWRSYEGVVLDPHLDHIALESEALKISTWEPVLFPALLQTEDYARAVMRGAGVEVLTDDTIQTRLEVRMARQHRLSGDNPVQLTAIIDESAFRRPVDQSGALERQIEHVLKVCDEPNITVQVMPFTAGVHAGMTGSVTLLVCEDDIRFAFQETASGDMFMDQPADLRVCQDVVDRLRSSALSPAATKKWMAQLAAENTSRAE